MRIAQLSVMLIMTVLVVTVGSQFAYAEQGFTFVKPSWVFGVQNFIEDIRLHVATGVDKIELIKEFALDKQSRIDEALTRGDTVSLALEERRLELLDRKDINIVYLKSLKAEYNKIAELNSIRILYSQFPDCIENCTEAQKELFNDKVNGLNAWQEKCSGVFDINNFQYTFDSFDKLKQSCPTLKDYSQKHLKLAITGST